MTRRKAAISVVPTPPKPPDDPSAWARFLGRVSAAKAHDDDAPDV